MKNRILKSSMLTCISRRKLTMEALEQRQLLAVDITFEASSAMPTGKQPFDIVADDLDGDGDVDLVTANQCADDPYIPRHCGGPIYAVSVLLNHGDGTFAPEVRYEVGGEYPQGVAVADIDSDGRNDLVVTNGADFVLLLLGTADRTFDEAGQFPAGKDPRSIVAGDFDGNGTIDLATNNMLSYDTPADAVTVLWGGGDGTFDAPVSVAAGPAAVGITIGDMDNDGDPDIITANGEGSVSVLRDRGVKTLANASIYPLQTRTPTEVSVGHFNDDGHLDVVATGDQLSVLLGTGDGEGSLGEAIRYGTRNSNPAPHPFLSFMGVGTADLDGDDDVDIAAIDFDRSIMTVLSNNAEGRFPHETVRDVSRGPWAMDMGDFDSDGNVDVAVADNGRSDVVVYFNTTRFPGDANMDGRVNAADLNILGLNWRGTNRTWAEGDFTGDGNVDATDLNVLALNWRKAKAQAAAAAKETGHRRAERPPRAPLAVPERPLSERDRDAELHTGTVHPDYQYPAAATRPYSDNHAFMPHDALLRTNRFLRLESYPRSGQISNDTTDTSVDAVFAQLGTEWEVF